ncbi:hypothetical protein OPT61_g62 [Boeremia exigua]|uniref:Uncharacterized protein n=1 Tax=Boeremia exigua TaxID=749465 RepID=A0ACC2IV55_9PLEO|nr:hypothetical protein OPT61_g62 [Boeremia exigua]
MTTSFDYIVVGGGTAGVVIASRLSQYLPSVRIALIEAGPNAVNHPKVNDVTEPMAWISLMSEGLVVDYSTTPQENLDGRRIINPAGHLLSGSSGVNVGTWMRASAADHALMAKRTGHERFLYQNMIKYYKRLETHFDTSADMDFHGFDGPIHTIGKRDYPLRAIIEKSAGSIGHLYNPIASNGDPIGLADFVHCFRATSEGTVTRQHSGKVYNLSNVTVFCDAPAARVVLDDERRATGIELISGVILRADHEVIMCCGTQRTPQLLMLSGIGPHAELSKHNISVLVDSPAVGQNYSDHSAFTSYYKLNDSSKGYSKPFTDREQASYGHGLPSDFTCFANIPANELMPHLTTDRQNLGDHPTLMEKRCHFMSLIMYYPLPAHPLLYPEIASDNKGSYISVAAIHMQPLSRGTVTLKSADSRDHPVCDPRFFSTNTDKFIMRTAIRDNIRLTATVPLADELAGEVAPVGFPALTLDSSDEDIDARVRALTMTVAHPMGTCAIGSVLDDEFRVKGVSGLRICDASVFPEPIGAMPSCAIYALAEMCAELVAGVE